MPRLTLDISAAFRGNLMEVIQRRRPQLAGDTIERDELPPEVELEITRLEKQYYDARMAGQFTCEKSTCLKAEENKKTYAIAGSIDRHSLEGGFVSKESVYMECDVVDDKVTEVRIRKSESEDDNTRYEQASLPVDGVESILAAIRSNRDGHVVQLDDSITLLDVRNLRAVDKKGGGMREYIEGEATLSSPVGIEGGYGYGSHITKFVIRYQAVTFRFYNNGKCAVSFKDRVSDAV